ncbi:DUF397 domain-containing protein [Streptomyces sp. MST-110588]|uniref:DUF397 domain-containing protein n=1 Tax=Streptomyces sp. MST-110588 TaxID=2833628 RepID=UPI001F5D35AC|nr:DUF397 domain-containing protein [Streptomyces sp. MST-110588]UNO44004.1 DUF397 domain-containing protein [Streptomyces sp. MST-110588]
MRETPQWRKSTFSENTGDANCVELATYGDEIFVRESDEPDTVLKTTSPEVRALLASIKTGGLGRPE